MVMSLHYQNNRSKFLKLSEEPAQFTENKDSVTDSISQSEH